MTNGQPLTTGEKIKQGLVFAVAKLIPIFPLIGLTMIHSGQSAASYMPYILFYTALKTGLLFVNSLGHVQNAFKITSISMVLAAGALLVLAISPWLYLTDMAAFILGASASVIMPTYEGVYYHERVVWKWYLMGTEIKTLLGFSLLTAGGLIIASHFSYRLVFVVIMGFVLIGLMGMQRFEPFVKQPGEAVFVPQTKSVNNLELFIWVTIMAFALRYLRLFEAKFVWQLVLIAIVGLIGLVIRVILTRGMQTNMPAWLLIAALINGAFETFLMLYIFVAVQNKALMIAAYMTYGIGMLLAQVMRRTIQGRFTQLSDLKGQLLGCIIGAWLMMIPYTILLGIVLISFFGSANSILLNHRAYNTGVTTPAQTLIVKYRNTYLGSILMQFILIIGLMGLAALRQQNLAAMIAQISGSVAMTNTTSQLIHLAGLISVGWLTVIAGLAGKYLPAIDENPLT
ncbi:hypothetical protein [Latilactobacillus fragifolii]|uniref:hypothetical protein n=1 Tax=Latilactobacillus fragifolii TaxID=2814244 RepID=UPI001ABA50E5|nr:hypothetical protein [Latilactobacillus fragifolii]